MMAWWLDDDELRGHRDLGRRNALCLWSSTSTVDRIFTWMVGWLDGVMEL